MKSKRLKTVLCFVTFMLLPLIVFPQKNAPAKDIQPKKASNPDPQKIRSVEGITEYQLQNGLRILLFPDKTKQTTTVNITYLVGSRFENYGETGMAHLLEHMLFKGSTLHTNIPQELTSHGARPNGTTWFDRTNYFETFSSTDENLNWALDLESDRMVNSFIAKKDFDTEFSVVRNEMEAGENDPSSILMERVFSTAYLWHNYGKSTIGARSDVENVPINRLQDFYHLYYQPDNAVLTVTGNFDPEKTLILINTKFGVIPKPSRVLPKVYTLEPVQDGERNVTLRRKGDVQIVSCAYHIPAGSDTNFLAIRVLSGLLTDNPSGRLYKKLIDTHKASTVESDCEALRDPGLLYFEVTVPKEKSIEEAQKILENEIESFVKEKPTAEEVDRIKNKMLKDIDLLLNSSEKIGLTLSEYIAQGDWRLLFYSRDLLKKVTADQVMNAATNYFKESNRTSGIFIPTESPERSLIPPVPDITSMLKDYKGNQNIQEGEAFEASAENIQKHLNAFQAEGLKINLLSKKNRGEAVNALITFRFGNEKDLMGKGLIPQFTASMIDKGTTSKSRQQIQDQLDLLKTKLNIYGSATEVNVSIETTHPNLAAVIRLVQEMFRQPSFPSDELEKLKLERITQFEQDKSEPRSIAVNEIMRYYDPYSKEDPRHVMTIDESIENIKKISDSDIKTFYHDFYGASNAYISVVGDFDETEIKDALTTAFKDWKSPASFVRLEAKPRDMKTMNKDIQVPDKANAFFIVLQPIQITTKDSTYDALQLGNYMLGGGFLNSRLAVRIRQKEGISYGIGSQLSVDYFEKNSGTFLAYAIYAPENVERLEKAYKEEIQRLITDGFTDQEVAEAKSGLLQSRKVSIAQDNNLAATLNAYTFYGEKINWWKVNNDRINNLTTAQINAVIRKYLTPDKVSFVKAGNFTPKKTN